MEGMDIKADENETLKELMEEKDCLDASFVHATRLLTEEIKRVENGGDILQKENSGDSGGERGKINPLVIDVSSTTPIKLCVKILIPVKEHPKFNFVGKLLGPRGNSLKRLQEITGTKIAILGRGSMRDKQKEDKLREENNQKYAHLNEDLHVQIDLIGSPHEAYYRLAHSIAEVQKYLVPDPNDTIRQEQLRELAVISGSFTGPPPNAPGSRGRPRGVGPGPGWGGCPPPMRGPHPHVGPMHSPARMGSPPGRGMPRGMTPRGAPTRGNSRGLARGGFRGGASGHRMSVPQYGSSQVEGGDNYYERSYDQSYSQGYEDTNTSGATSVQEFSATGEGYSEQSYGGASETESTWSSEGAQMRLKYPSAMHQKETIRTHPYNRY
ncbi:KH domain-containing, RNA-binding, signal transduction-associated protein 2-like isoform X1 [Lytechinus variegatus]|uniref:KH domain-containing, RNA-binding, signal transduction-associated protein 2-like isoform X1 n=1 Tax=Lytechinus variegatus TaxID=7654 RepID=UPI001BB0FCB7|nr:KH domain-containing, RNA-binding, signal transduction-associated protein 2-like isoform X1 [Lytechinus variegatus]